MTTAPHVVIDLGSGDELVELYSYPNGPNSKLFPQLENESLKDTILYYFNQTLERDGCKAQGATADITVDASGYHLVLNGPGNIMGDLQMYKKTLPAFLENGRKALKITQPLKDTPQWDPKDDGWRFFLPFGLPLIRQRSVQFFHFPPVRLLDTYRNYLYDPVPKRWEQLLRHNGVKAEEVALYETIIDSTTVAAPDNAGVDISRLPFEAFEAYEKAQVELLVLPHNETHNIPVVVLGIQPMAKFETLYGTNLDFLVSQTAVINDRETAVLGTTHPYHFYVAAQLDRSNKELEHGGIGSGRLSGKNCKLATMLMVQDLIAARWQATMAEDPTRNPDAVLAACTEYWTDDARKPEICALVRAEGSLKTGLTGDFSFPTKDNPDNVDLEVAYEAALPYCSEHANEPCPCGDA